MMTPPTSRYPEPMGQGLFQWHIKNSQLDRRFRAQKNSALSKRDLAANWFRRM
jgi:hypothetical protein